MTITFKEKLAPNADLKTVVESAARELTEGTQSSYCQICLSNSLNPCLTSIYEHRSTCETPADSGLYNSIFTLTAAGMLLGKIIIGAQREFTPEESVQLSESIMSLGPAIQRAQVADVVQRQTFRKTFLTEIDNVMTYSLGVGDALFVIVNILGKLLNVSRCIFVCTDDAQAGWKSYEYWVQGQVQSCQSYNWPTTDSPLVAQSLLAEKPLVLYGAVPNSFSTPAQEELQFIGAQSFLAMPLKTESGVHGCVMLQQCDFRRQWKPEEVDVLQSAADTVAKGLLKLPAEKLVREPIMQLHQHHISYKDEEGGKRKIDAVRIALKGALTEQAIPSGKSVSAVFTHAAGYAEKREDPAETAILAEAAISITTEEKHKGKKGKNKKSTTVPSEQKVKEALSTSSPVSDYIFATPGVDIKTLGRIEGWIRQIELNDKYANGHAVPVAQYATAIAQQLGLQTTEVSTIRLAALVHDIGKLGIAPYILQKEDEDLSDAELLISMKHPQDGAGLLQSFSDLASVAPIVYAHHEEYDGNGFPLGIKGEDIPLAARILFVANSYHVMVSPRKTKITPMSAEQAQQRLKDGSGKQYDPRVVQALLSAIEQKLVPTN